MLVSLEGYENDIYMDGFVKSVKKGFKKTGKGIKKVAKTTGHGLKETGKGIKKVATTTGHGLKETGKFTVKEVKKAASMVKNNPKLASSISAAAATAAGVPPQEALLIANSAGNALTTVKKKAKKNPSIDVAKYEQVYNQKLAEATAQVAQYNREKINNPYNNGNENIIASSLMKYFEKGQIF